MVDFRYHLVTIIAIFLALALGIVVGTTQLNGQVLDDLNGRIDGLAADKRDLEGTVVEERAFRQADDELAEQVAAAAVAGQLSGERVVVVSAPNAPSELAEQLVPLLEAAGATVGTRVLLRPDLIDPARTSVVQDVVGRVAPAGLELSGDPVSQAGSEIAAALLDPVAAPGPGISVTEAGEVLQGFQDSDLIAIDGDVLARGTVAVLLTGEAVRSADAQGVRTRVAALLRVGAALDAAGQGAVVSGPLAAADDGGLIRALRDDGSLRSTVSSVDGVDRPQGRIVTVRALRQQVDGDSGHYGTGPDNDGPSPALDG